MYGTDIYRIDLTITNWAKHIGYFVLHDTKNIVLFFVTLHEYASLRLNAHVNIQLLRTLKLA